MLVRNGLGYLTAFEIVFKIYKGQAISKRDSLHSSVNKHLDMHSLTIMYKLLKKDKKYKE